MQERTDRTFEIGNKEENSKRFPSNHISTAKYNAITFIPKALLIQFKRYANIYFLVVAILQSIPAISPLNPISAIAPLIFVITLSVIREGLEDLARYRSDLETNGQKTRVFRDGQLKEIDWKDVYVGDIVQVKDREFFPADIVVLHSSDPKGNCFIMTSSLDGEKNLKPRFAKEETQGMVSPAGINISGQITCAPPNPDLYSFRGQLDSPGGQVFFGAK